MSFKLKRVLLVALILGASGFVTKTMISGRERPPSEPVVNSAPLVDVLELAATQVQFEVTSQGTAQPAVETRLAAEVSGAIVSVSPKFVAGAAFEANETLLRIDPTLYEAAVTQARATLNQRQIEYDGIKRLDAKNYRSKIDLAAAEAALAAARAELTRAKNNLDKTNIRLPYAGIVRERSVDVGQFVALGTLLGTTFGSERIEVRLPMTQSDLRFVDLPDTGIDNEELAVPVTLNGEYRGRPANWAGRVVRTEATIDPANRVTYAVVEVNDPYRRGSETPHAMALPVGTFVSARVPGIFVDNVLAVPRSAVRGDGQLVFVDAEGQLRLRDVDIIRSDGRTAWIDATNIEERRLVLTMLETPVNGQAVRIAGEGPSDYDGGEGLVTGAE